MNEKLEDSRIIITQWEKSEHPLSGDIFQDDPRLADAINRFVETRLIDSLYIDRNICITKGNLYYGAFLESYLQLVSPQS